MTTEEPSGGHRKMGRPKGTGSRGPSKTRSVTFTESLLEEALNAVDYLRGDPNTKISFTQLLEEALTEKIAELSDKHNKGEPFPQRKGRLKPGPN